MQHSKENIFFFAYDAFEPTIIKRMLSFSSEGYSIFSFSMKRKNFVPSFQPTWPDVHLGYSENEKYLIRLIRMVKAVIRSLGHWTLLKKCQVIYARNMDMCAIALLVKWLGPTSAPIVYECLDVRPILTGSGFASKLFRLAERFILSKCSLLVVSSPRYITDYFEKIQGYSGRVLVLENKLWFPNEIISRPRAKDLLPAPAAPRDKWVLGWFGTLRCERTLSLLLDLIDALPNKVEVLIRGVPIRSMLPNFDEKINNRQGVIYGGAYKNPQDLLDIYSKVHFIISQDFSDGVNSDWLLPNRIYEGSYFGCVSLAGKRSETGRKIESIGIGWALEDPFEGNLVKFLASLSSEEYLEKRKQVLQIPSRYFVQEPEELSHIVETAKSP